MTVIIINAGFALILLYLHVIIVIVVLISHPNKGRLLVKNNILFGGFILYLDGAFLAVNMVLLLMLIVVVN